MRDILGRPARNPFPILAGTPQELKQLAPGVDVAEIEPGDSVEL